MKKGIKLSDIAKNNVYQVPEGYFERLPMHIMARTAAQERIAASPWQEQLWLPVRFALAPLLLLLLFAGVYFFGGQQAPHRDRFHMAALSDQEIVDYLDADAQVETMDLEEHLTADLSLASDFLNVSSITAEEELEYYTLNDLDY